MSDLTDPDPVLPSLLLCLCTLTGPSAGSQLPLLLACKVCMYADPTWRNVLQNNCIAINGVVVSAARCLTNSLDNLDQKIALTYKRIAGDHVAMLLRVNIFIGHSSDTPVFLLIYNASEWCRAAAALRAPAAPRSALFASPGPLRGRVGRV